MRELFILNRRSIRICITSEKEERTARDKWPMFTQDCFLFTDMRIHKTNLEGSEVIFEMYRKMLCQRSYSIPLDFTSWYSFSKKLLEGND